MENNKGYIYILTNPSMPWIIKIGITKKLKKRLKALDTTVVPTPFTLYYAIKIEDYERREKLIHQGYDRDRIRPNREFFTLEPENAVAMLKALWGEEVSTDLTNITIDHDGREISTDVYEERLPRLTPSNFEILQIPVGSKLVFTRDDWIECLVIGRKQVKYNGQIYSSISNLTEIILKEEYHWRNARVNGYWYWKFEGELLQDRRVRLENQGDDDEE